jgi:hypothetical protein
MSNKPGCPNVLSSHHTHVVLPVLDLPYRWLSELLLYYARNRTLLWFPSVLHIRCEMKTLLLYCLARGQDSHTAKESTLKELITAFLSRWTPYLALLPEMEDASIRPSAWARLLAGTERLVYTVRAHVNGSVGQRNQFPDASLL